MNPENDRHGRLRASPQSPKKTKPPLRTHKRAFFLVAFYLALILTPWIVTAKLTFRPLTKPSWEYAAGISFKDYKSMQAWARAIPILNAVAAVLAVPIISSVIAQATVVFAQRRSQGQRLSVRQLFKLADRSWMNLGTMHKMFCWDEPGHARVNWYIIACAGLVILGAVQFPLYQFLAPWEEVTMATCEDTRYMRQIFDIRTCDFNYRFEELGHRQIGIDLEPAQMAVIPAQYILPRIKNDLTTLHEDQAEPHIWKEPLSYGDTTIGFEGLRGFVAALPGGATTGVLREHIMRLNSTASCSSLDISGFPATCSGDNPFQASLQYKGIYDWGRTNENVSTVDICAPGNLGKHPWTVSRNRQGLSEEVFLKFSGYEYDAGVVHCTGLTTRGYFELGNVHNGDTFGPLLEKWPSSGASPNESQFHDFMGRDWSGPSSEGNYLPSEEDTTRGGARPVPDTRTWRDDPYVPDTYTNMSGPLMTSVLALFGPGSWLDGLSNLTSARDEDKDALDTLNSDQPALLSALCNAVPFRHFTTSSVGSTYGHDGCGDSMLRLMMTYSDHMSRWSSNTTAEARLNIAMFLANQAALTSHTMGILPWMPDTGREIYTAPGIRVRKPVVSLPSLVILSVIVGLQVVGLVWLGVWIFMWPTWTRTLDAMAIARVAASIDLTLLPSFRTVGHKDWDKLARVDGLVGAQIREEANEQQHGTAAVRGVDTDEEIHMRTLSVASTVGKEPASETVSAEIANEASVELGLGAPGPVSRRWCNQTRPNSSVNYADV